MIPRSWGSVVGGVVILMVGSGDWRFAVHTSMIFRAVMTGVGVVTTAGCETDGTGGNRFVAPSLGDGFGNSTAVEVVNCGVLVVDVEQAASATTVHVPMAHRRSEETRRTR